ncbi:MAG: helix-turn-helix domain-containing protein [Patescibacteria group bacterium]
MNEKILIECGLSPEQAKIYTFLLSNGFSSAKVIASKTSIGRALTYKIIDQLIDMDLVEKREDIGKIALFLPKHPRNIKSMVETKKQNLNHAFSDFNTIFGTLSSEFNSLVGRPNIKFYEGVEGIERVHEDILEIGQDILVMSSPIHEGRQEVLHLIKEQIEKQVAKNIRTKAIAPYTEKQPIATPIEDDEKYLITRKKVSADKLNIPAQIIIYGDKVSITNFKESMLTIVIESKYISETFRIMFDYIWNHG